MQGRSSQFKSKKFSESLNKKNRYKLYAKSMFSPVCNLRS